MSPDGQVEYTALAGIRYMWWYHLLGLIWTSEFFLTCQQIVISGATVTWYLHRYVRSHWDEMVAESVLCYQPVSLLSLIWLIAENKSLRPSPMDSPGGLITSSVTDVI